MSIEVSPGELVDKITILEIRIAHCADPKKRVMFERELAQLQEAFRGLAAGVEVEPFLAELSEVNRRLWTIEDDIRDCERRGDFGAAFIALARSVYKTNDVRSRIKNAINRRLDSQFLEEKSYAPY